MLAGGSGIRQIHLQLTRNAKITRVVPVSDDGGSSKSIREHFHVLPVGDIRNALMTAAIACPHGRAAVRLFNWRLPAQAPQRDLVRQMQSMHEGEHSLVKKLQPAIRQAVKTYLAAFLRLSRGMSLQGGCIGNFILVGALKLHGDINTAIAELGRTMLVDDSVWPVSVEHDLRLAATLGNGSHVIGQAKVTAIDRHLITNKIIKLTYLRSQKIPVVNPKVVEAIADADLIVYGPGSFFTSILPHVMVEGIVPAIAARHCRKVFIGNLVEGNECFGYHLDELLRYFIKTATLHAGGKLQRDGLLTDVIGNQCPAERSCTQSYLQPGRGLRRLANNGVGINLQDYEDPWHAGVHDAKLIGEELWSMLGLGKSSMQHAEMS